MSELKDTKEGSEPFLYPVLIDGKYIPSGLELMEILLEIDLNKALRDTKVVRLDRLTLSFDFLEHSHLFILALGARGRRNQMFTFSPNEEFFTPQPLRDFRVNGDQLSLSEELVENRTNASIILKYGDEEEKVKYSKFIREVINETMPHLADEIKEYRLK